MTDTNTLCKTPAERLAELEKIVPQAKTMADGITALIDATQKAIERHGIDTSKLDALECKMMQYSTAQEFAGYGQGVNERIRAIEARLNDTVKVSEFTKLWAHEMLHSQHMAKRSAPPHAQFVIVYGSLGAGIAIVGPFSTHDAARNYLVTDPDGAVIAEIIMLQAPAP